MRNAVPASAGLPNPQNAVLENAAAENLPLLRRPKANAVPASAVDDSGASASLSGNTSITGVHIGYSCLIKDVSCNVK